MSRAQLVQRRPLLAVEPGRIDAGPHRPGSRRAAPSNWTPQVTQIGSDTLQSCHGGPVSRQFIEANSFLLAFQALLVALTGAGIPPWLDAPQEPRLGAASCRSRSPASSPAIAIVPAAGRRAHVDRADPRPARRGRWRSAGRCTARGRRSRSSPRRCFVFAWMRDGHARGRRAPPALLHRAVSAATRRPPAGRRSSPAST